MEEKLIADGSYEIADVRLAFDINEIITLLNLRGVYIAQDNFKKVEEINEKIEGHL